MPSASRLLTSGWYQSGVNSRLRMPSIHSQHIAVVIPPSGTCDYRESTVETVCRNVKRWQGGDQQLRWVGSGLLYAESRWNRVHGYREIPILVKELELAILKGIPLRHATVA